MAYTFQVVVDSADPHKQADWWAETLGWDVEPSDEAFIRRMVAEGHAAESDTRTYNGTLVWAEGQAIRHPAGLERAPRVLFQKVPEGKRDEPRTGFGYGTFRWRGLTGLEDFSGVSSCERSGN